MSQLVAQLDAMEAQLGGDPPLSPADKRHAAKMRKGGAPIVAQIGNLAKHAQLASSGLDLDRMQQMTDQAAALQPLADRLAAFHTHVLDLLFVAQSDAWSEALTAYVLLSRLAQKDHDLATALAPVAAFFARRPKAPAAPGTPGKRARNANAKAVRRLQKHAPQLLASAAQPAASAGSEAPVAPATSTPTAPSATGGAPRS